MSDLFNKKVIVLAGATSSGKSAVSLEIVKHLGPDSVEIVIADSVQIYKDLNVASNKPTAEEMAVVTHHLVDFADPTENITAGDFCELAASKIVDISSRGKLPVIVGGSTMWIKWLVHGIPDAPAGSELAQRLSKELLASAESTKNWPVALSILESYSPSLANKLSLNDWYRMRRYLEIAIDIQQKNSTATASATSEAMPVTLSNERKPILSDYDVRSFFLMEDDRERLFHAIDSRCEKMLEAGLLQEVGDLLLQNKLTPSTLVWKSIGYRQTIHYLLNPSIEPGDLHAFLLFLSGFAADTRAYARKQHKFYRKDKSMLFLGINRQDVHRSKSGPHRRVAKEILHWTSEVDVGTFQTAITAQSKAASFVTKWRKLRRTPADATAVEDEIEFQVINAMMKTGEVAMDTSPKGRKEWEKICQSFGASDVNVSEDQIIKRPRKADEANLEGGENAITWGASNAKIRAEEDNRKMACYVSLLPSPNGLNPKVHSIEKAESRYRRFVVIADEYRARLQQEKPDLWSGFFETAGDEQVPDPQHDD
jgi:tRNA dimethylallyltransferase